MLKVATVLPHEPYREYKDVERVYSGSTEIDKILDKNGNVLFAVNKEVEGTPPLAYKGKEETNLKNYRIYGQTVDGESVGDRTGNLFDKSQFIQSNLVLKANSTYITKDPYTISTILPCKPNTKYTITKIITNRFIIWGCENYPVAGGNGNGDIVQDYNATSLTFTTGSNDNFLLVMLFYQRQPNDPTVEDVKNNLMYNYGEMCPYEPYGYKVPVTVTNGTDTQTTNLYLPEPIKMVGDEAEYIDYAEQKMHRVRKNLLNIETDIIPLGFQYGTVTIFNDSNVKGFFKECEPNTAYTISRKTSSNNNRFSIGFSLIKPENGLTQSLLDYTTPLDTLATSLTLTSPAGARYVCCYLSNINEDITPDMEIMLEKNDYATSYEPYIENTDLDVTLPALPVLPGTNTLTVGTEVQPSNVYLKGRIKEVS